MAKWLVILTLCIVGAALSRAGFDKEAATKKFMEAAAICSSETNALPQDIEDFLKKQRAASMEAKCLRACLLKKFDVMDANGKFVKAAAMEHAHMYTDGDADKLKLAEEIIDVCAAMVRSDNHCEAAEQLEVCFLEQAKAHGLEDMEM